MLKKEITYTDLNGNTQTDTCYFNLNKAELGRLQVKMDGKYIDYLQDLIAKKKIEQLYDFFYNLVLDSYGERSDDGKHFFKSDLKRAEFECSVAFSEILIDVIGDAEKMASFTKGILPPDMVTDAGGVNVKAIPSET